MCIVKLGRRIRELDRIYGVKNDDAKQRKIAVEYVNLCGYSRGGNRTSNCDNRSLKKLDIIAEELGISERTLYEILAIERKLTPEMKELLDKSVTIGESEKEKFLIRLFPSFSILVEQSPEQRKILHDKEILVEKRIRLKPKFTRYFLRRIVNNLKDG